MLKPGAGNAHGVQGYVAFGDTWGAPRSGGRTHQGVDLIGARKAVIGCADNHVWWTYHKTGMVCCDGRAGHHFRTRDETARIRLAEQEESARLGGYEFVPLLLPGAEWLAQWLPEWTVQELDFGNGRPAGDNARLQNLLPLPLEEIGAPQERAPPTASPASKPE